MQPTASNQQTKHSIKSKPTSQRTSKARVRVGNSQTQTKDSHNEKQQNDDLCQATPTRSNRPPSFLHRRRLWHSQELAIHDQTNSHLQADPNELCHRVINATERAIQRKNFSIDNRNLPSFASKSTSHCCRTKNPSTITHTTRTHADNVQMAKECLWWVGRKVSKVSNTEIRTSNSEMAPIGQKKVVGEVAKVERKL